MATSILSGQFLENQDTLDLAEVLKILCQKFRFTENKTQSISSLSSRTKSEIESDYLRQIKMQDIENWESFFSKELSPIHPDFQFEKIKSKLLKYQTLESYELIDAYNCIKVFHKIRKNFLYPQQHIESKEKIDKEFKELLKTVPLLFDERTKEIIHYKHPSLSPIDKKIKDSTKQIRVLLQKVSQDWAKKELLQDESYDVLDDRYLLPVRSDRYNSGLGKIVYRSNSGNTLFVEPNSLRELANQKAELEAALEREAYKILKSCTDTIASNKELYFPIIDYLKLVDSTYGRLWAKCRFQLCIPTFAKDNSNIFFKGMHHPLIENPIKNDLIQKGPLQGILISGPNTGGKTVLLKTMCLCLVLPHLGFAIPASDANIPYCTSLKFLSHDNQDLLEGLSSFSSEALVYLKTLKSSKPGDILFIDEIFNSTSSLEASQLAMGLIEKLNQKGVITFISSHHENLKEWIFSSSVLQSAHMGFIAGEGLPTYQLFLGSPGKSYAKEVFRRLEYDILKDTTVSDSIQSYSNSSDGVENKLAKLQELELSNSELQKELSLLKNSLEKEKVSISGLLDIERRQMEKEFEEKWKGLKTKTFELGERIKRGEVRNINKVSQKLSEMAPETPQREKAQNPAPENLGTAKVGESAYSRSIDKMGKVLKINHNKATAQFECSGIKMWLKLEDLYLSKDHSKKEELKVNVFVSKQSGQSSMLLDARGMRRDEFLVKAERHVLEVINGDLPFVDVIHGHGDGILKKSLYELLKRFKSDVRYDFIEGNLGTTRVELLN
jgi:DNA mismatch repair protein MutS2